MENNSSDFVNGFDVSIESRSDRLTKENISFLKLNSLQRSKEFQKLTSLLDLQQEVVKKHMHKIMSPISAISGYLNLVKVLLEKGADKEKIEEYISKSERVLGEVSDIVEDLHELFDEEDNELRKNSIATKMAGAGDSTTSLS